MRIIDIYEDLVRSPAEIVIEFSLSVLDALETAKTKQMGFAPLTVAVLDAAYAAAIDPALTPVLSAALVVLQIVVLAGAGILTYQDAVRARNKRARRQRRAEVARSRAAFEQALERRQTAGYDRRVCA